MQKKSLNVGNLFFLPNADRKLCNINKDLVLSGIQLNCSRCCEKVVLVYAAFLNSATTLWRLRFRLYLFATNDLQVNVAFAGSICAWIYLWVKQMGLLFSKGMNAILCGTLVLQLRKLYGYLRCCTVEVCFTEVSDWFVRLFQSSWLRESSGEHLRCYAIVAEQSIIKKLVELHC